jgi:hypothetical protein
MSKLGFETVVIIDGRAYPTGKVYELDAVVKEILEGVTDAICKVFDPSNEEATND